MANKLSGCSRASAQAIVNLLLAESGGGALLLLNRSKLNRPSSPDVNISVNSNSLDDPPTPAQGDKPKSKVTQEIINFLHGPDRGLPVKILQETILARYGAKFSVKLIYTVWNTRKPTR
jgi:hypothetical protein